MAAWIDEIPLDTGPQRFGNKAYRVWHKRMEDVRSSAADNWITHSILKEN